jgi:hypothetical protein
LVRNLALASRNAACGKAFPVTPPYQPIFQVPDCKRFEGRNRQISYQKYDDPCIDTYLALAGLPERKVPIAAERALASARYVIGSGVVSQ